MSRKNHVALLKKLAAIRDLQSIAAQTRAARASEVLREKADVLAKEEVAQKSGEDRWIAFLSAPTLSVEMMPSWSAALFDHRESVRRASDAVERATGELKQRAVDWRVAEVRSKNAQEQARKAAKDRVRSIEEKAHQESSDRHIQKRGAR